ncbi:MAG TPA: hypothetical protein VG733_14265, partial [Chthoniobacteraceae bacterium]|nr:hypothetical protein [Chthoniobacteraceae bacterium]
MFFLIPALLAVLGIIDATMLYFLGNSAKRYVDDSVPEIVRAWVAGELDKRASSEFKDMLPEKEMARRFARCRESLGTLAMYVGSKGGVKIFNANDPNGGGALITA